MKKIILVLIIFIACYFIYNLTIDKKVSYLTLGDILSKGTNEYGVSNNGYSNYIRDYLKDKGMLKEYNNTFTSNDYRILDIIRILSYNEKKDNYSLNRLIKESDIITVSLGMSEIYNKILTIDDLVMLFFDKAPQMLFKLVMLFNDNISFFDDNVFISIFNSLPNVIYIYLTFSISDTPYLIKYRQFKLTFLELFTSNSNK